MHLIDQIVIIAHSIEQVLSTDICIIINYYKTSLFNYILQLGLSTSNLQLSVNMIFAYKEY